MGNEVSDCDTHVAHVARSSLAYGNREKLSSVFLENSSKFHATRDEDLRGLRGGYNLTQTALNGKFEELLGTGRRDHSLDSDPASGQTFLLRHVQEGAECEGQDIQVRGVVGRWASRRARASASCGGSAGAPPTRQHVALIRKLPGRKCQRPRNLAVALHTLVRAAIDTHTHSNVPEQVRVCMCVLCVRATACVRRKIVCD